MEFKKINSSIKYISKYLKLQFYILLIIFIFIVIFILNIAKDILMPIALSLILSFIFSPIIKRLENLNISRSISAAFIVFSILFFVIIGIKISLTPINEWFDHTPILLKQIERKLNPIRKTVKEVDKAAEEIDRITSLSNDSPLTIEIEENKFKNKFYDNLQYIVTNIILIAFLLYFILSWGKVVLLKTSNLFKDKEKQNVFLEISSTLEYEISKYMITITIINVCLAAIVGIFLYLVNMPNAITWSILTLVLNFIPYLGPFLAVILLGVTALISFDGFQIPLLIVSIFVTLTVIEGQIITPLVLGNSFSINPLIVFINIMFWYWLWGVAGVFIAVPFLIILNLMGDRVDFLHSISVITNR